MYALIEEWNYGKRRKTANFKETRIQKDQDRCTVHMKWGELNVFQVFGYGRVTSRVM